MLRAATLPSFLGRFASRQTKSRLCAWKCEPSMSPPTAAPPESDNSAAERYAREQKGEMRAECARGLVGSLGER